MEAKERTAKQKAKQNAKSQPVQNANQEQPLWQKIREQITKLQPRKAERKTVSEPAQVASPRAENGKLLPKYKWLKLFNWKWFALVFATATLLVVGLMVTIVLSSSFLPIEKMNQQDTSAIIYDKSNKEFARLKKKKYEFVPISELRKHNNLLVETFKKVEDVRFDQHNGIDYYALMRAVVMAIFTDRTQGGGTITMQVARNVVLESYVQTMSRKLSEMAVALNLERKYTKEQILEAYINHITFGNNIYGVQLAAKAYFNKDLTKESLTPGEVAILVGLPKNPSGYNPYRTKLDSTGQTGKERLKQRQKVVLAEMAEENEMEPLITEEEKKKWQEAPLNIQPESNFNAHVKKYMATPFDDLIEKELKEKYPQFEYDKLNTSGLKIYTNIDPKVQAAVEAALKNENNFISFDGKKMPVGAVEAGVTVINPKDGSIVAIGGGRYFQAKLTRNRAFDQHQPGSTIKPLTVFAPAVQERGFNENTMLKDEAITVSGKTIQNFDLKYYGDISMGNALKYSLNASTIWLLKDHVGLDKAFEYGKKLGLPLVAEDKQYSPLGLGGLTKGVSTKDMAQAYATFLNEGQYFEAHVIREVKGKLPDEKEETTVKAEYTAKEVFDKQTAWYMTRMLRNNIMDADGTKSARLVDGRQVAGKSGTTQNKDKGWFVGFTPEYVTAVTVFNGMPGDLEEYQKQGGSAQPEKYQITGAGAPARIFSQIMSTALQGTPPKAFVRPEGVSDPAIPLPQIDVKGEYSDGKVSLNWTNAGEGVKYMVERSEDNQNFEVIARELITTSYVDQVGELGFWDRALSFFGREKSYYYRVTVIDANHPNNQKTATIQVTISN